VSVRLKPDTTYDTELKFAGTRAVVAYRHRDSRIRQTPAPGEHNSEATDPPGMHPYPYDVAPDGRILALVPTTEGIQQLTVLMNWLTALDP
jgi:hypothetical protein